MRVHCLGYIAPNNSAGPSDLDCLQVSEFGYKPKVNNEKDGMYRLSPGASGAYRGCLYPCAPPRYAPPRHPLYIHAPK